MKLSGLAILTAGLAMVEAPVQAQTNTNTPALPSAANIGQDILGFFSSFNTNLTGTFGAQRFNLWAGASSIQGGRVPLVNDIGLSYDVWQPATAGLATNIFKPQFFLDVEDVVRNSGAAGTVVSDQGGIGLGLILVDTKAVLYGHGGAYMEGKGSAYAELGIRLEKALGQHWFSGVGLGVQVPRNAQVLSACVGASF